MLLFLNNCETPYIYIYIYVCMCVCVCVCMCVCVREREREREREKKKLIESDRMYVEKGKTKERYMFDSLFICQCVSTSWFCLNTKIFYLKKFSIRNNYNYYFLFNWKSLSGLLGTAMCKNVIIQADMLK